LNDNDTLEEIGMKGDVFVHVNLRLKGGKRCDEAVNLNIIM